MSEVEGQEEAKREVEEAEVLKTKTAIPEAVEEGKREQVGSSLSKENSSPSSGEEEEDQQGMLEAMEEEEVLGEMDLEEVEGATLLLMTRSVEWEDREASAGEGVLGELGLGPEAEGEMGELLEGVGEPEGEQPLGKLPLEGLEGRGASGVGAGAALVEASTSFPMVRLVTKGALEVLEGAPVVREATLTEYSIPH